MEDFGIKVSKSAHSVLTDAAQKMLMHSGYPLLKSFETNTGTLVKNAGNSSKTVVIPHNLGYTPIAYVFGKYLDENAYPAVSVVDRYKVFSRWDTPGLRLFQRYRYTVDATNLNIIFTTDAYTASEVSLPYIYYIFYDPE